MKKLLSVLCTILVLTLAVTFAGCTQNDATDTGNAQKKTIVGVWDCVSLTQILGEQSDTSPYPAETCILTVNENGTFKATSLSYDLVSGKWSQDGNTVTLSNIVHYEASNDDGVWSIIVTDNNHITLQYEAEVGTGINEFSSYNLQRKN